MRELKLTILGVPRTKKNSQRIIKVGNGYRIVQSKEYVKYEKDAVAQILAMHKTWHIDYLCNVKCIYYRPNRIRCDQSNLISATDDILVKAGVIQDDNFSIIGGHDGSRVRIDKENPRVEITITEMHDDE